MHFVKKKPKEKRLDFIKKLKAYLGALFREIEIE